MSIIIDILNRYPNLYFNVYFNIPLRFQLASLLIGVVQYSRNKKGGRIMSKWTDKETDESNAKLATRLGLRELNYEERLERVRANLSTFEMSDANYLNLYYGFVFDMVEGVIVDADYDDLAKQQHKEKQEQKLLDQEVRELQKYWKEQYCNKKRGT